MQKDVSRLAVERAIKVIGLVRESIKARMPFGPGKVQLDPKEARLLIQKMSPSAKESLVAAMGSDKWDELMGRLYGGR